jgi:predicted DNA-binding WGR domain protein
MPEPIQLPLFPDQAALTRIKPARNEWRFYRLAVCPPLAIPSGSAGRNLDPAPPDLFGRALLARQWGRIGALGPRSPRPVPGRRRRDQRACPARPRQAPPRLSG